MPKTVRPNFVIPEAGWDQLDYWTRKSEAECFVYVIQPAADFPIKIGKAKNVPMRIAELQTGNPRPLVLLHVLVGDLALERELHDLLGPDARLMGEWFAGAKVPAFLDMLERLGADMVLRHKNSKHLPDYRQFSPFRERHLRPAYVDWADRRRKDRLAS